VAYALVRAAPRLLSTPGVRLASHVRYGPQTTDEMAVSFMGFIVDVKSDPAKVLPSRREDPRRRSSNHRDFQSRKRQKM
jgi:hypothetical protein